MELIPLKKKSKIGQISKTWKCPKNCKISKTPCKHLELLLPQIVNKTRHKNNNVSTVYYSNIDNYYEDYALKLLQKGNSLTLSEFTSSLNKYNLAKWRINLIIARFFDNKTLSEIAKEQGYVYRMTVKRLLVQTCIMLKERGFSFPERSYE